MSIGLKWYKKVFIEYKKEIINSMIISFVMTVVFSFWHFYRGDKFQWENQDFIAAPLWCLRLLSGLVFLLPGKLLYKFKFYYVLNFLFVDLLKARGIYDDLKKVIWYFLIFIMGAYILPWTIDIINFILSIFYNLWFLILYLAPATGAFLLVFFILAIVHYCINFKSKE